MSEMFQGDIHRLYQTLRREQPAAKRPLAPLNHVREIRSYYMRISCQELLLLLAWAKKEESGIGLIPATLSGVPLIGLIFAPFIQGSVRAMAPWVWMVLWLVGAVAFVMGVYVHHRQKAYTTLHIQILEQLCHLSPFKEPEVPGNVTIMQDGIQEGSAPH
jgi:hypothetical protein